MNLLLRIILAIGVLMVPVNCAFAATPYVTDDASIFAPGQCQLEFGKQVKRGNHEI